MMERGLKNINVFIQRLETFFVTFFYVFNVFNFFLERFLHLCCRRSWFRGRMCNSENATWNASSSDNGTASRPYEPNTVAIYAQFAAILSLVVVTVTGNLLLLAIVFRSRQLLSTVSNALIVNLAVADCLVGVFILPAFAATVLRGSTAAAPGLCSASKNRTAYGRSRGTSQARGFSARVSARRSVWWRSCCRPSRCWRWALSPSTATSTSATRWSTCDLPSRTRWSSSSVCDSRCLAFSRMLYAA